LLYFVHGIPEIGAYFIAGLAGSMVSIAIIHKHYKKKKFYKVINDVAVLFLIGAVILGLAGLIEVYVSPIIPSLL